MASQGTREPETFTEGAVDGVIVRPLARHADDRGWLTEIYRNDELSPENRPAMAYVSETLPGVARGPHHHLDQSDCFVLIGPGEFTLYFWDIRPDSLTWGKRMVLGPKESFHQRVIVPPGVVHAYRNTGTVPGWVFNAANRLYAGEGKQGPVDEVRHEDREQSPYRLDLSG